MELKYSNYQKAIFNEIEHGVSNIVVEASAGSAKTTTIIKSLDFIDSSKRVLFIAFNTSIVNELKEKIGYKPNVKVCTMHSLGRTLIQKSGYSVELDAKKYFKYVSTSPVFFALKKLFKRYKINEFGELKAICQLISLCRNNLSRTEKNIKDISDRYNICTSTITQIRDSEIDIVKDALSWGQSGFSTIDFDDMIWLPNVLNLVPSYVGYDYIFLDEAQDANNAQIDLFLKYRKNGTRVIAVGDKDQSIYNFRGVDGTTFDKLKCMTNTVALPLSISYRCPKKVVEYARQFSDNIEAWDNAEEGEINENVKVNDITDNSMVLCRDNAPLAQLYLTLIRHNRHAYICGNDDMFNKLQNKIADSSFSKLSADLKDNGFIPELYKSLFDYKDELCNELHRDDFAVFTSRSFKSKYDSIQTAVVLSDGLSTTQQLSERIDNIVNQNTDGIRLSTVHKAKGLESDDVFILCNSLMPSSMAEMDWEFEEERHIQYVAYTRAKKTLNFIDENDFRNFSLNKKEFADRMKKLEVVINKITGRKTVNHTSTPEMSSVIAKVSEAKKVEETDETEEIVKTPEINYAPKRRKSQKR